MTGRSDTLAARPQIRLTQEALSMGDAIGAIVGAMAMLLPAWLYLLIGPGPCAACDR